MQPLVLSPKVWMCMPRWALGSWPVMSQEMVVGSDSEACSKVTVPLILASPRTTQTVCPSGEKVSDRVESNGGWLHASGRKIQGPLILQLYPTLRGLDTQGWQAPKVMKLPIKVLQDVVDCRI